VTGFSRFCTEGLYAPPVAVQRSRCTACGVESAPVDGVCTNCWAPKERRRAGLAPARTEPFWRDGGGWEWPWAALGGSTCLGLVVLAVVLFGLEWLIIGLIVLAVVAVGWGILTGILS
jgi:hypothetical protein